MRKSAFVDMLRKRYGDKPLVGAEVGVYKGDHAQYMLAQLNMQKLYLIDPYCAEDDFQAYMGRKAQKMYQVAQSQLRPYMDKVTLLKMKSQYGLPTLPKKSFDFIYIDANHRYDYVREDIQLSMPLLKRDGILGGHDYGFRDWPAIDVKEAVDDFVRRSSHDVQGKKDWWFPKLMIHFIWIGGADFLYPHYLAMKTANTVYNVRPYLWTDGSIPSGEWIEKVTGFAVVKSIREKWMKIVNKQENISARSNYIRYRLLFQYGGLYLDMDTLCLRSLFENTDNLPGVVVAWQDDEMSLLNGAIMYVEERYNPDIAQMITYVPRLFKQQTKHGETGPSTVTKFLRRTHERNTLLQRNVLYPFEWQEWEQIFHEGDIPNSSVLHWWAQASHASSHRLARRLVTPEYIKESDSVYAKAVRAVLGTDIS